MLVQQDLEVYFHPLIYITGINTAETTSIKW